MRPVSWYKRCSAGFVAGFLMASLVFGGLVTAADIVQRDIRVSFLPLKFMFDNAEKTPPADQQPFTYNGRTFVPLRFMADSVGKAVEYDPDTYTIWVGRRPSPVPDRWQGYKVEGKGIGRVEFFESGAMTVNGEPIPKALLITTSALVGPDDAADPTAITKYSWEIPTNGAYKSLSGRLFVPMHYFGQLGASRVASVAVLDHNRTRLFGSVTLLANGDASLPIQADLEAAKSVLVIVTVHHTDGALQPNGMSLSQVGLTLDLN